MIFLNSGPLIRLSDVIAVEKEFKIKVPEDYVSFLVENNGGAPERQFYSTASNDYVIN